MHLAGLRLHVEERVRRGRAILLLMVLSQALLACGTSGSPGTASEASVTLPSNELQVSSEALPEGKGPHEIPFEFECKEKSIWLPLEWSAVPSNTQEIAVVITVTQLAESSKGVESSLDTQWIIGGLMPSINALFVGPPPTNAFITGHNVQTPNCPPRGRRSGVSFNVFALPEGEPLRSFEEIALVTVEDIAERAIASGSLLTFYGAG
jgi:phosphatidylethanolamine-binding protein (PEBP) family uncharacterized protein